MGPLDGGAIRKRRAPIWITKDAGVFKKNGLDVNLIFIPGGPTAAAAMLAGEVQAVAMAGPEPILAVRS